MRLGTNLQALRALHGNMTQEKLAERMGVSRQTISKWETGEACPELDKLLELTSIFSCTLDALLREDLSAQADYLSPVSLVTVPAFTMASHAIISTRPEDDVQLILRDWASRSGLAGWPEPPRMIGWDFPFLSVEQQNRFGMRGYEAAWILPDGFVPRCEGPRICSQPAARYAKITVRDPFRAAFDRIPKGYQALLACLETSSVNESRTGALLPCFEEVYEADGATLMDIYLLAGDPGR
ncbi:MAG: helix-turn-helix domain-containing protein [Candidatus Ventricola sp.]